MQKRLKLEVFDDYNIPKTCRHCGGVMIYKGVGEYECEKCHDIDFDDYGKVRLYIEEHKGATAAEIEVAIGVSQKSIRRLLRESRIQIADNSRSFIHCEACGKDISSGRFCLDCEMKIHRNLEAEQRAEMQKSFKGYMKNDKKEDGQRRFMRGDR